MEDLYIRRREDLGRELTSVSPQVFSHDYWKSEWGIPTLDERKAIVSGRHRDGDDVPAAAVVKKVKIGRKQRRDSDSSSSPPKKKFVRRGAGVKRKQEVTDTPTYTPTTSKRTKKSADPVMEVSPFEAVATYKCNFCPKRSQNLAKMEQHVAADHEAALAAGGGGASYKILTRDQVNIPCCIY